MSKITYIPKSFHGTSLTLIDQANAIINEYAAQGFSLTLRQLYYQMVARGLIPNNVRSYKRLGSIVTNARLAGLIDWYAIVDRTRELKGNSHWGTPVEIMKSAVESYRIDKWASQPYRVEVWIEKDALAGIIAGICSEMDIDYFSCRGYTSASEMWKAGRRMQGYMYDGQDVAVLHFGDHDPSGIDMTRDIQDRLNLFSEWSVDVDRIALNMDQIDKYNPPPNPTKLTDSRAGGYIQVYGHESWELDALEPSVMAALIEDKVVAWRDEGLWNEMVEREKYERGLLSTAADSVKEMLK